MERLQFTIDINADITKVYNTMLAKDTYKQWTAEFNPTSDFEGSWEKGAKILFVGTSKEGKKEGMVSRIKENIPNKFVSIEHQGILDGDNEITEGPQIDGWAGAMENYSFEEKNGGTTVTVEVDVNGEFKDYMQETFPKALKRLKEISEG